jgi:hypothetical protein
MLAMAILAGVVGCHRGPRVTTAEEAIEVSNAYLSSFPHPMKVAMFRTSAVERGTRWQVTYRHDGLGGPFVITIDKTSGNVVSAEGEQ